MKIICAFSSDRRDLYKADIYRVLALPKGHIIHFRYKKKYIDENLLDKMYELDGQKVAIFFTHGNEDNNSKDLTHTSIRTATVKHYEFSEVTDVFHVYLQLDEFCNISIDSGNSNEKLPGTKFFSELSCTTRASDKNWQSRIGLVSENFPGISFSHLHEISDGKKEVEVKYRDNNKSCYYDLTHGKRYILKFSIGNPCGAESKILLTESSEEISFNSLNPIETSVDYDDFDIPLSIKSLQVVKQSSLLQIEPTNGSNKLSAYATNIELNLKKGKCTAIIFGLLATAAIWSLILITPSADTAKLGSWINVLAGSLLLWSTTSLSFYLFNKK